MTESRARSTRVESRSGLTGSRDRGVGFTLLEVMLAIVVIGIVMTAVFRLQAQTISMADSNRFYTTAMLLAQQKMAELRGGDPRVAAGGGDFGENYPGFSWSVSVSGVDSAPLGETGRDLMRIDLVISSNPGGRAYRLREYRLFQE
ncbi:MAG: prepilin-type N-terminal cleavage/methylation domain-containing protein [Desulfobacterales bacterium]|nr:prepilin-type N-terminal cleavage/methylation domain-containing protein [Desulfobacterales bacterium]